jgi:hypothetical protein
MPFQYRRPPSFIRPIAIAAGVVALGVIAALVIAQPIRAIWIRHHDVSHIGVPVGVPDAQASPAAIVQNSPAQPIASAPQIASAPTTTTTQAQQPAAVETSSCCDGRRRHHSHRGKSERRKRAGKLDRLDQSGSCAR